MKQVPGRPGLGCNREIRGRVFVWCVHGLVLPDFPREVSKCLFAPDRTLMVDSVSDATQAEFREPMSCLGLCVRLWV